MGVRLGQAVPHPARQRSGVVRLTAHTYPRDGSYGLALGNRLLTKLRIGSTLVVSGHAGARMCYRVTKRVDIRANQTLPAYYDAGGRPRLAILVCSGVRRGPGDWSHRTIWFAQPVAAPHGLERACARDSAQLSAGKYESPGKARDQSSSSRHGAQAEPAFQ